MAMKRVAACVVVRKSVLKKPAMGGKPGVVADLMEPKDPVKRKGATKPSLVDVLNEASLAQLQGQDITSIDRFVQSLEDKDQQRLSKKFQACRQIEGAQEGCQKLVSQPGGRTHANKLLRVYRQSGCTTKAVPYQTMRGAIEERSTLGSSEKWQPLHYMLSHKYGPQELKARVIAGTIKVRPCSSDNRFSEFLEVTDYSRDETRKVKTKTISIQDKTTWDSFSCLAQMENTGQRLVFSKTEDKEEDLDPAEFAFGKKLPRNEQLKLQDVGLKFQQSEADTAQWQA